MPYKELIIRNIDYQKITDLFYVNLLLRWRGAQFCNCSLCSHTKLA